MHQWEHHEQLLNESVLVKLLWILQRLLTNTQCNVVEFELLLQVAVVHARQLVAQDDNGEAAVLVVLPLVVLALVEIDEVLSEYALHFLVEAFDIRLEPFFLERSWKARLAIVRKVRRVSHAIVHLEPEVDDLLHVLVVVHYCFQCLLLTFFVLLWHFFTL